MKITTQDIIKMLPFEADFKSNLLGNWDTFSEDQRFSIEQTLWDAYAAVYQIKYDQNMQEAFLQVEDGQEKFDEQLGQRIKEKTESDLLESFEKAVPEANLSVARAALQDIINNSPQGN